MNNLIQYYYRNYKQDYLNLKFNVHAIEGYLYSRNDPYLKEYLSTFKNKWIRQRYQNQVYILEYQKLKSILKKEKLYHMPLKGIWILENNYYKNIGERKLSDIDLYINKNEYPQIKNILIVLGFSEIIQTKWWGNNYKYEFTKNINGLEIIIELHTKIFFHITNTGYEYLESLEGKIVHLCGHLAFQHTFSKLYWLFDLYHIVSKEMNILRWRKIIQISRELKLEKSVQLTLKILQNYFSLKLPAEIIEYYELNVTKWYDQYLTPAFLLTGNENFLNYQLVKFITKDKISISMKYYFLWFINKLKS